MGETRATASLSRGVQIRSWILTFASFLVAGALVAGSVVTVVFALYWHQPVEWGYPIVYGVLSAVVAVIGLRAYQRVRATQARGAFAVLARMSPFLMVAGAAAGCAVVYLAEWDLYAARETEMIERCQARGQSGHSCLEASRRCEADYREARRADTGFEVKHDPFLASCLDEAIGTSAR